MSTDPETGGNSSANYAQHGDGPDGIGREDHQVASRQSSLFFGICDMRTATVALDVLNVCFTGVVAIVLSLMFLVQGGPFVMSNIMGAVGGGLMTAGVSVIGLVAAMTWHLAGMYCASVGFVALLVYRIVNMDYVDIVVTALLLYPHVMLSVEMRSGILSKDTYDKEEYIVEAGRDFVEMAHGYISPDDSTQQQQ